MNYSIDNYGKTSAFASFLPGIAGEKGIPIWCYYVNRGQGVVSFGVNNKDNAIMEFYPAHVAYQNVKRTGFRTFIRKNGKFLEPFSNEHVPHNMEIEMNSLSLTETDHINEFTTEVSYFVLPEERVGGLVRKVTITNNGDEANFEVLDGMANVIPFGVGMDSMKNMTQTAKAWMQVEDHKARTPYYRVRASMADSAKVTKLDAGNFALGYDENGELLEVVVDADAVFGYDLSLGRPAVFEEGGMAAVEAVTENISNLLPTAFFKRRQVLKKDEAIVFYEIVGQVAKKELLGSFIERVNGADFFIKKEAIAKNLVEELTDKIATKTGSEMFDAYTRYTFMDNVLRGGLPIKLAGDKIFYVYSRKHGDLERDYNYFAMLPEFYSQGNGNFRDVNQNRRCDTFFAPYVEKENIHTFYKLIQLDGYNPLGIEKMTYTHPEMEGEFTPGELMAKLLSENDENKADEIFNRIMSEAKGGVTANFGEGYWSDHWTYNLDLVEEYLELYPDKEEELLFEKEYTYFLSQALINKRAKRYEKTDNGVRQYYALNPDKRRNTKEKEVQVNGKTYKGTLMEKLILLCATKFAALDPYKMGVEMEGGKPGWYDALNGLPGMLGSSMAETYELRRMLEYTIEALGRFDVEVELFTELASFITKLSEATENEINNIKTQSLLLDYWNLTADMLEEYRENTYEGLNGKTQFISSKQLEKILTLFAIVVDCGIAKAKKIAGDICPTYFTYEVTSFTEDEAGLHPTDFKVQNVPYFLEGPVRYLKLKTTIDEKQKLYKNVKASDLYDEKLNMYKVNASLENASFEIGRCRAFTPGWLENESIWLHMEYKYLLELLKSGLYKEFSIDFHNQCIPFLDPKVYGRSTLENSSFIVSSKNPNSKIHGKGFVARLSGSTIEFISMWKRIMFGEKPFRYENGQLILTLNPIMPKYLIAEDNTVRTTLLGGIEVEYKFAKKTDYFPGNYTITGYKVTLKNGTVESVTGPEIQGKLAMQVRNLEVSKIEVSIW